MSFKTILVPLDGSGNGMPALETALAVARAFRGHLEVLHVKGDPREMMHFLAEPATAGSAELVMEAAERSAIERAARARTLFGDFCARNGVKVGATPPEADAAFAMWFEEPGLAGEVAARRGRLADLIVMALPTQKGGDQALFESVLLETGRPVLVAPPRPPASLGAHVVVAWNDSVQAARAAAAAGPFLAAAEKVTAITVNAPEAAVAAPGDLAAWLAWRGIRAATRTVRAEAKEAGATLLEQVAALGGDLLVMGGYGHSRMREVIFGGVTRHVLQSARFPVLMMH